MLYIAEHKTLYKTAGLPELIKIGKKLPEHAPLTYEAWKEKRLKGQKLPEGYMYLGLDEILIQMGYIVEPTLPEGGKRPVNRFWRTLGSTETNQPKKSD